MSGYQVCEMKLEKILGLDYFDGPMSGVAIQTDGKAYYFKIVGWDEEHCERVFAMAEIQTKVAERVWRAFEAVEAPRLPTWYPQSDGIGETRVEVHAAIAALRADWQSARFAKIIQSEDLSGKVIGIELRDADVQTIQQMVSTDKLIEVKSAPVLEEFLRTIRI